MEKEKLTGYIEEAQNGGREYFKQGMNCSECAFKSYLDLKKTDFPPEIIALSSGFGGGIGMTKNTCGALLGACLAAATTKGRKNPLEKENFDERVAQLNGQGGIYETFGKLVREFEAEFGSVTCRELTAPFEDFHSKERKKYCQKIVCFAAGLGTKYALQDCEE